MNIALVIYFSHYFSVSYNHISSHTSRTFLNNPFLVQNNKTSNFRSIPNLQTSQKPPTVSALYTSTQNWRLWAAFHIRYFASCCNCTWRNKIDDRYTQTCCLSFSLSLSHTHTNTLWRVIIRHSRARWHSSQLRAHCFSVMSLGSGDEVGEEASGKVMCAAPIDAPFFPEVEYIYIDRRVYI